MILHLSILFLFLTKVRIYCYTIYEYIILHKENDFIRLLNHVPQI